MKNKFMVSVLLVASVFLVTGCSSKLKNGEEKMVSFKGVESITADDFYEMLKEKYGEDEIVDLIDETILNKKYEKSTEEDVYVNEQIENIKQQAGENYLAYLKQYYNADDEAELKSMLRLNYKRNKWVEEYTQSKVSEDEISDYYDEKTIGDMKLYHILVTPQVSSDATDKEKKAAEKEAKKKAEAIIKELDNGADFKKLAKKYSEDTGTSSKGGSLGYVNRDGYDENFIEGAVDLKKNEYTKTPVKSAYGYHIILKTDQKKKPKLEKVSDDIKKTIANEKLSNDSTLYLKALEALRKEYKMKISDSKIKQAYNNKQDELYKAQENSNQNAQ